MNNYDDQLKELEKMEAEIAKQRDAILKAKEEEAANAQRYDNLVAEMGAKSGRDLIKRLMAHFNVRSISLSDAAVAPVLKSAKVRSRVKVTPELVVAVKAALAEGTKKTRIQQQFGISYPVVKGIADGKYDA